jgi:hypothetical protein
MNKLEIDTKTLNRSEWQNDLLLCLSNVRADVDLLENNSRPLHPGRYNDAKYNLEREIAWLGKMLERGPKVAK